MKRFYKNIHISYRGEYGTAEYHGGVFAGVQLKDHEGQIVKSIKEFLKSTGNELLYVFFRQSSEVCGIETDQSSGWISLGGPIKGSYALKNGEDRYSDYISDFGMRVEDPCQASDDKRNINLRPSHTTVKDLRYHEGTDSQFWLRSVC